MDDSSSKPGPRRNTFELMLPALLVLAAVLSLFSGRTSGVALGAVLGFGHFGGRLVRRHRGAAKRDLQLLMVVFYAGFGVLSLAVTLLHEQDRWFMPLLASILNGALLRADLRSTTKRHREAAELG